MRHQWQMYLRLVVCRTVLGFYHIGSSRLSHTRFVMEDIFFGSHYLLREGCRATVDVGTRITKNLTQETRDYVNSPEQLRIT
jgi:hypothetical protein